MVVVQFDFPVAVVFLLDLVDVVVGEICGHIVRDLLWHNAGRHDAVDGGMLAVHFNPLKRMVEFQFGLVVELHLVVMLRLMAVVDTGLREVRFHKHHDFGSDFAEIDGYAEFLDFPLLLVLRCLGQVFLGVGFGAGRSQEGHCHQKDEC